MQPINITINELLTYLMIVGFVIGVLLGLIPFFLGRRRNQTKLGLYALIASALVGIATPVLSIVVVGIMSWIIIQKSRAETPIPDEETDNS